MTAAPTPLEAQLRSLLDAAQAGVSSLALREVLQRTLSAVRDLFGAHAAAAWRIDESNAVRRYGSVGLSEAYVRAATSAEAGDGVTEMVVSTGRPLAIADVRAETRLPRLSALLDENVASLLAAPLFTRGRASGALTVYRRDCHEFDRTEVELLAGLANLAAAAIDNALLHARTERALTEVSEQREVLRTIVETAQDGILAIDAENRILLFSSGCERLTGVSSARAEGRQFSQVLTFDQHDSVVCPDDCPIKPTIPLPGEHASYTELPLRRPDGSVRWVGASLARVAGRRVGRVRAVMVLRDITAAKEMDELKSSLLTTISHELRTPLTSIRALSELLVEHDFEPGEIRQVAATINRESERLTRLVDNVLDAARIEAGRMPCHLQPVQLEEVVREALTVLEGRAGQHRVRVEIPSETPRVLADPDRLRQVLDNLLSNAVKYSPPDGEVVLNAAAENEHVRIEVIDRGPGIPDEHLPRLFERFHRVDPQSGPGGTGLGLYITRNLVELMNGAIAVRSRPGQGCVFTVELPRADVA